MPTVTAIEIVEDRTATSRCDEGFLRVKRYRARNRRSDGTVSAEYAIDVLDRATLDAVAVCLWARTARGVVLTRSGLRPAPSFRRGRPTVLPERDILFLEEVIAGAVEPGEVGPDALRRRAAAEVLEEAGLHVAPERLETLGAPLFVHPPVSSDRLHLLCAEVTRDGTAADAAGVGPSRLVAPLGPRRFRLEAAPHARERLTPARPQRPAPRSPTRAPKRRRCSARPASRACA